MHIDSTAVWKSVTWDVARGGGFTAYILLTLAVVAGLALSAQVQSPGRWPRIINNEMHNFLTLIASIFTGIHILAVWIDPFTRFGWSAIFIPFVTTYRTTWMSLGIVAFYLGLAIGLSTLIRPWIGYKLWRKMHIATLAIYALVTVHGFFTGTDAQTWWGLAIYLISILLVAGFLLRRLLVPTSPRSQAHPVLALMVVVAVLLSVTWTVMGIIVK